MEGVGCRWIRGLLKLSVENGLKVVARLASSGSFDSAAHDEAVSGFAQDDSVKQTTAGPSSSPGFTRRCALPQRWPLACPITFGAMKKSFSLEHNVLSMIHRLPFLLMAIVQAFFAFRCLRNPQAVKRVNIDKRTIWENLPLSFYRGIGLLCASAASLFFYMFLKPPSN